MAYYFKSKALLLLGRTDEAIATSRAVLERDPNNVLAYADLGLIYSVMGQRDKAIEMFETALRIDPTFSSARESLSRLRGF
jgi:tetratricopeptide (TPR) repeat protein